MNKILRIIGAMLLVTALVISLIPVSDVEAASTSDFQIEGTKLLKYSGTDEIVSIPADVRSVGEEAFAGNSNVVKVNINDKCKSIEYGAFANCSNLRTVNIGNDVELIDSAAFANDSNLKTVSIGAGVKKLGSGVFAGDTQLERVSLSEGNTHLALVDNCIYSNDMTKLYCMLPTYKNQLYELPRSVSEISGYAFWGNDNIVNVELASGLVSVPEFSFSNCKNLKRINIPLPIRSIDAKAFEDCVNLLEVKCPDSMTYISDSAFDGCPKVTINGSPGSYSYKFGQELAKSLIEEIEYEDVDDSALVTQESVESFTPVTRDNNETVVIEGSPEHNTEALNEEDNDGELVESPEISANNAAAYSTGVINGADVMGIKYSTSSDVPSGNSLGGSSIVSGRAFIFIDNKSKVISGKDSFIDLSIADDESKTDNEPKDNNKKNDIKNNNDRNNADNENSSNEDASITEASIGDVIKDKASKGINFPKFTIVNGKIASQSYYLDSSLDNYDFPEDITDIGDFAFARSGLTKINIPDGVKTIGYGAFYHCDSLTDVKVPDSVEDIASYAFTDTPFVNNNKDEFVIVGDGILVAYKGNSNTVNIPEGVKIIADGTFRDNLGITAVNFPESLVKIGEDAFNGCSSLLVANRGYNVTEIGANAFKGTSLNNVTIYENVNKIGTGAFDLNNGTDTVTFLGKELPAIEEGTSAKRLANVGDRTYIFGNMKSAIIDSSITHLTDTVLEPGKYGFKGRVVDQFGNTVSDNTSGVYLRTDSGINIDSNSGYINANSVSANITGDQGAYTLHIIDSQNAKEAIALAYSELYGGNKPENLIGVDISLKDESDTLSISKLGKQSVNITMDIPASLNAGNLHIVTLDSDGQLEAVPFTYSEDNKQVTLKCEHFSPYGFYNYGDVDELTKTGDRIKDDTPDTGDYGINPKWFLVIGCISLAIVLFLVSSKKKIQM